MRVAVAVLALAFAATAVAHPLMTRSQARAIVRDVNLKASDMARYDALPTDPDSRGDRALLTEIARCTGGVPPSKGLATGGSPLFLHGNADDFEFFASIVTVFPRAAHVSKDLRALRGARGRECLRSAAASGTDPSTVTATTLHSAVSGVFGYRFKQEIPSDQRTPLYLDYIFMGTRQGEATVIIVSHPAPPAQSLQDKVIRIVKTRLKARLDPNTVL